MKGTLKLPPGFSWSSVLAGLKPPFRAWLHAPLDLKQGDEVEIDVPLAEPTLDAPRAVRATGRIIAVAVHADGRLWYQFAADSTVTIDSGTPTNH